jgi:hypothetical protein
MVISNAPKVKTHIFTGLEPVRSGKKFQTPVLLLTFNRPDSTQAVFNEIRKARPVQLVVATDVPRKDHLEDIEKSRKVLEIIWQIDWDCTLSILSRDENLGSKIGIIAAIDWFFSQFDEGIILEDDCVPDQSFFLFCQELLERYRDDKRITMISGNNYQFGKRRTNYSYYFSRYTLCWGWATWKRAWQYHDINMKQWPSIREGSWLNDILHDQKTVKYWTSYFEDTYKTEIYSWDYQWLFISWIQGGLCIQPNTNLVSNIGFNEFATNTKDKKNILSNVPVSRLQFPLNHPPFIIRDDQADQVTQKIVFPIATFISKTRYLLGHMLVGRV